MGERRRVIDKHVPQMAPDEAARRRQVALFRSADIHSTHERMEEHDVCASCAAHRAEAVVLARIAEARPGSLPMKPALWDARFDAVGAVLAGTTANAPVSTTRLAELSRGAASGPRDEDAGPSRGHHRKGDVERGDDERELGRSVEAALQSFKWFSDFDAKIGGVYFSLVGKRLRLVDIIKAFSIEAGCVYVRWVSPDRDAPLHATLHFAVPHSIRLCVCVNVGLDRAPVAKTIAPHADRSRRKRSGPEPTAGEDAEKKASAPTPPPPPLSRDKGKEKADAPEGDGAAAAAAAAAAKLEAYVKTAVWQRQRELLGARPPTVHKGVGLPSQGRRRRADGLHYLAAMDERDMLRERLDEMPTEMLILDSEDVAMAQSIMYYTCMCV
jgi:hypothetical protein